MCIDLCKIPFYRGPKCAAVSIGRGCHPSYYSLRKTKRCFSEQTADVEAVVENDVDVDFDVDGAFDETAKELPWFVGTCLPRHVWWAGLIWTNMT